MNSTGSASRAQRHTRIFRRQESRAPHARRHRLNRRAQVGANRVHHDERGKVLGHVPQAVRQPRSDARPPADHGSGLDERDRRLVIDLLGVERLHDRDVVDHLRGMRQQLRYPRSAPAVLRELVNRRRNRKPRLPRRHRRQALSLPHRIGQILVVPILEAGLVIEEILLRRAAEHVHVHGALRLRREVRQVRQSTQVLFRRGPERGVAASRPNIVASAATPSPRAVREKN